MRLFGAPVHEMRQGAVRAPCVEAPGVVDLVRGTSAFMALAPDGAASRRAGPGRSGALPCATSRTRPSMAAATTHPAPRVFGCVGAAARFNSWSGSGRSSRCAPRQSTPRVPRAVVHEALKCAVYSARSACDPRRIRESTSPPRPDVASTAELLSAGWLPRRLDGPGGHVTSPLRAAPPGRSGVGVFKVRTWCMSHACGRPELRDGFVRRQSGRRNPAIPLSGSSWRSRAPGPCRGHRSPGFRGKRHMDVPRPRVRAWTSVRAVTRTPGVRRPHPEPTAFAARPQATSRPPVQ